MSDEELIFFQQMPEMLPVYEKLRERLEAAYPDMGVKVAKTQISLRNRYVFAVVSLPRRKLKGWPEKYVLVSFGLGWKMENNRIVQTVEPYPGRWTHHVILERPEDVDGELMDWLDLAYGFAMTK